MTFYWLFLKFGLSLPFTNIFSGHILFPITHVLQIVTAA